LVSAHSVADSLAGLHRELDNFDGERDLWKRPRKHEAAVVRV